MAETARQRRVREEGEQWEVYVTAFLREQLTDKGLRVFRGWELPEPLRQVLSLPLTSLWGEVDLDAVGDKALVFGDVDIVVAKSNQPIVIVSCKLSLHNRLTETLFWSVVYK